MKNSKVAVAAMVLAGVVCAGTEARADATGYVCSVSNHTPTSSSNGPSGLIHFSLYSGPDCTGSYIAAYDVYSTALTDGSSLNQAPAPFDNMFRGLLQAVSTNDRVMVTMYGGLLSGFVYYVSFIAN